MPVRHRRRDGRENCRLSYQQLVQNLVFAPLGGIAAFGNPGLAAKPQPWGHKQTMFGTVTEVTTADAVNTTPLAIEPAGEHRHRCRTGAFSPCSASPIAPATRA